MSSHTTTFRAFAELQLACLPAGGPADDPDAITAEVFEYVRALPSVLETLFGTALDRLNGAAQETFTRPFHQLNVGERETVLDDLWGDHVWHELVSLVVRVGWLVIYSRDAARRRIGFALPTAPLVDRPEPPRPALDPEYDVCIVGSGAGGSVVAARAAEAGKRVLMLDDGRWVSPKDFPVRDDRALRDLYRSAGVQPALPALDHVLRPGGLTFINVLQARVAGGGPAINNAIHLPISEQRFAEWSAKYECPVPWPAVQDKLALVARDLHVNTTESGAPGGQRAATFRAAAQELALNPRNLPVSLHGCIGCGGCNCGCRFGLKTGGLHGVRPHGAPRSYFERALAAGAAVAPEVEARTFDGGFLGFGSKVRGLRARDRRANRDVRIRAKRYVLAAGPIASSQVLFRSGFQLASPIGRYLAANVVMSVFAVLPVEIAPGPFDPGLQMCVYVDQNGRLLETWFHYPGSIAVALPEWLRRHVAIMGQYRRLAACGVVVPTDRRGEINRVTNTLVLSLSDDELTRLVRGIINVAEIFMKAGAETVIPSTARPLYLRRDHFADDQRLLRQSIRGPADLNLATAHPQGGNAIGRHETRSVVNGRFALYDFKNLFVADASLFPAGCGVNPQMTAMALAHLAADNVLVGL
jgi:choline dehydrogenase-like flavoprotein